MRKHIALLCVILAWIPFGERVSRAERMLPTPVLALDFESDGVGLTAKGKGVAGGHCLDVSPPNRPLIISDPNVLSALSGAWSFTVTGWIRRSVDMSREDPTESCIVNCPGFFRVILDKTYRWRLGLEVRRSEPAETSGLWSSWLADFYPDDRWVFFAVTYDGTKSENNYSVCCGYEQYAVREDQRGSTNGGQLSAGTPDCLVIGASTPKGEGRLSGMIDGIRIYATSEKSGLCALDQQQLDKVRRADLGSEYSQKLAAAKEKRARDEAESLLTIEKAHWSKPLNLHRVDGLERIFADRPPMPCKAEPASVPRGGSAALQFATISHGKDARAFGMEVSPIRDSGGTVLAGRVKLYELINVPVEANNNGGMRTSVSRKPPPIWMEDFLRVAPFSLAEALAESDTIVLGGTPASYRGILLAADVSPDAKPGVYRGILKLKSADASVSAPFSIEVHKTRVPCEPMLSTHYWLSPDPRDLTSRTPPEWWSEQHWRLLENSSRVLRQFGQDTLWTPLIDGQKPLIRTIREPDGSYSFDFGGFDRWMEMCLRLGFKRAAGHHIVNLPGSRGITVTDRASGREEYLFGLPTHEKEWQEFAPIFMDALCAHLTEKGWVGRYIQHLYDEPRDFEKYKTLSEMLRKHMPGVRSIDAIKTKPEYSPLVDIQVFDVFLVYPHAQRLAAERKSRGQENWVYHCCSPYPPYPNRHLDERLSDSQLYPWLCYLMNADGYLYWAANMNRGADPYKTSVGPLPNGSQDPGHPPGDNWMFYPGPDGLRGSMRMVAFRDGLLDHALLTMLAQRNRARADEIMKGIATDIVHYAKEPAAFHAARKALLRELDADPNASSP